jgi:hypothetical protein
VKLPCYRAFLLSAPGWGAPEKSFHIKEKNVGVFIGVVVLLVCVGFVVLMMVSEWSEAPASQPLAENPAPAPSKSKKAPAKKAAAKKKPAAKKKKK